MLQITDFKKSYHGIPALEIPYLLIPKGIHWIKGSNGAGKTTLFRSIAGMIPFKGQILLEDTFEVNKNPVEYRLRVNYGEAEPNYPEFLTALDLIQFVGKAKKASEKQMFDLIEQLEIGSYVNNQLGTFSSGMLKKTSLVLSFLGNPSLILLDEPLITIDQKAIENMFRLVQTYQKQGVSFLLSSHQEFKVDEFTISNTYWIENRTVVLKN